MVLPTYADLERATLDLKAKIDALKAQPSNAAFKAAAESWIAARTPWETSEAFLFGPVADLGLDPNMDSWPLDQVGIVNVLKSGKYDALNWSGDFDEDNKAIGAAQGLRGFHTLEYLTLQGRHAPHHQVNRAEHETALSLFLAAAQRPLWSSCEFLLFFDGFSWIGKVPHSFTDDNEQFK